MRGFLIGTAIGLISVAIVVGVGYCGMVLSDRGHGEAAIVALVTGMVIASGIYGAKTL